MGEKEKGSECMEAYTIFKSLCIIVIAAKICGILARKLKAPQVVGEILAGVLIGPSVLGLVEQSDFLAQLAEIGVVLLMFSAGLQTNLHDLLRTGLKAFAIACAGVLVPLVGGTLLYMAFYGASPLGSPEFYRAVFIGVIMTATSVSITVQTLKELGKLSTEVGTTILSAAIIDDVIGIIVLTFVIGMSGGEAQPVSVVLKTVLFFVFALLLQHFELIVDQFEFLDMFQGIWFGHNALNKFIKEAALVVLGQSHAVAHYLNERVHISFIELKIGQELRQTFLTFFTDLIVRPQQILVKRGFFQPVTNLRKGLFIKLFGLLGHALKQSVVVQQIEKALCYTAMIGVQDVSCAPVIFFMGKDRVGINGFLDIIALKAIDHTIVNTGAEIHVVQAIAVLQQGGWSDVLTV